jgi:hypothetical protein
MGYNLKGYVLEKPRVGAANSPYTASPDNLVSDPATYNSVYGVDEANPGRTEYLVLVLVDGNLPDAELGWTKNEGGIFRFDYDGAEGKFRPLPGSRRLVAGTLTPGSLGPPIVPSSNVDRLKVPPPTVSSTYSPYRIAVGEIGSGITFPVTLVATDSAFTPGGPASGLVELSQATGNLNWHTDDLTTYAGQEVLYQRQSFYTLKESQGFLGTIGTDTILLNPIPGQGSVPGSYQQPLLRLGFGPYLTPISVPDETWFTDPILGTFEWASDTGRVNFNSTLHGELVYYEGSLFETGRNLPRVTLGTIGAPAFPITLPASGEDLVFRAVGGTSPHQFPEFSLVSTLTSPGKTGVVQVDSATGAVLFSDPDISAYGGDTAEVVYGDLTLERGMSIRFFRSPVNLDGGNPSVKDLSAYYPTIGASLANPIIGAPMVFLPVLPIDDPLFSMSFRVTQGTGTFVGTLPRLDVPSPPAGYGYTLDFESKQLNLAFRRDLEVTPLSSGTGVVSLAPLISPSNVVFELDLGTGYAPLVVGQDVLLESTSGVLTFVDQRGYLVVDGANGLVHSSTDTIFEDSGASFSHVNPWDLLFVTAGPQRGVYTVTAQLSPTTLRIDPPMTGGGSSLSYEVRHDKEVLADRFFQEVSLVDPHTTVEKVRPLGTITNGSPRLSIPVSQVSTSRFRYGTGSYSSTVTAVPIFSNPSLMPQGEVEVDQVTGELNFSSVDVGAGGVVSWVFLLTEGRDYRLSGELGTIQTTERLLGWDGLLITYPASVDNQVSGAPLVFTQEQGTFLVRKERLLHSTPASSFPFNPNHRALASDPAATVYRGGRPQDSTQVTIDYLNSVINFLPDKLPTPSGFSQVTDALPHGAIVGPTESIYVDYYIYEAIGGENTTTVLKSPILLFPVQISEGDASFTIKGNRTAEFPAGYLLRVEGAEVYYLDAPTYDPASDVTTVNLAFAPPPPIPPPPGTPGQVFRNSYSNPKLYVSSGPIRITPTIAQPSYFVVEGSPFVQVPRGMDRFRISSDRTPDYIAGVVVYFSGSGNQDFYLVSGSTYDTASDLTEIVLTQTSARQYNSTYTLRRSVRPVYEATATNFQTSGAPAVNTPDTLLQTVILFREVEGSVGVILTSPTDFKMDDSGKVGLTVPLASHEEISILYTKYRSVGPGNFRASYTSSIAPTDTNGILNQVLLGYFTTYIPDSFYYRVETMTNFRGELAQQYQDEAKASAPSGGPRTDNTSQPLLFQQGQPSVFFTEGHLANEDIVARATLLYYNVIINYLEDVLQDMDGRVVGDYDGRFRFDGTTGSVVPSFSAATNQIDDRVKISNFPYDYTTHTFVGTYIQAYQAGSQSRFYPTFAVKDGYTVVGPSPATGDQILDFQVKPLTGSFPTVARSFPRARVVRAGRMGDTSIEVDTTGAVTDPPFRAGFAASELVVIRDALGTFYVPESAPLTILMVGGPTTLDFVSGLPIDVPIGATVYLASTDAAYQRGYRVGTDVTLDLEKGFLLYVKPYPPFDGSDPAIPPPLQIRPPNDGELLQGSLLMASNSTSPTKFPALYGQAVDDDGNQGYPLINPTLVQEGITGDLGFLGRELAFVSATGIFNTDTVPPYLGSGALDPSGTVLTSSVPFPVFPDPTPQIGDLVRVVGPGSPTNFHRILSVVGLAITVDDPFVVPLDPNVDFLVTVANNLTAGTCTTVGVVLTDPFGTFQTSGVIPGDTVVSMLPAAASFLERRQVASVDSEIQLTLFSPFYVDLVAEDYRIHNPLNTFSQIDDLITAANGTFGVVGSGPTSEVSSIDSFFAASFTDRLSPTVAAGTISGHTLTAVGVDFIASGVVVNDFVYVPAPQTSEGIYLITDVPSPTELTLKDTPTAGLVSFRVVSAFGVGETTLKNAFSARQQAVAFGNQTYPWLDLISIPIWVQTPTGIDGSSFARGYTATDISDRSTDIINRQAALPTQVSALVGTLVSGDRLYDRRYTWIDARINLEKGILVRESRAVADRIKAQQDTLNQLTKLLAVQ